MGTYMLEVGLYKIITSLESMKIEWFFEIEE